MVRINESPEHRRGAVWLWLVPIGVLGVVGVLWLATALEDDDTLEEGAASGYVEELGEQQQSDFEPVDYTVEPEAKPEGSQVVLVEAGAVATLDELAAADSPEALIGRRIAVSDLRVTEVTGDATFYVRAADGTPERQYFVFLGEERTPDTPIEGRYDVTPGQSVTLYGTVREAPAEPPRDWDLGPEEAEALADDRIYLYADRLTIDERPE